MRAAAVSMLRQLEAEMKRYALLIPLAFLFTACPPGALGDECDEDSDCDADAGLHCEIPTDATADEKGTCEEDMTTPAT
jgi:hypothetical protein